MFIHGKNAIINITAADGTTVIDLSGVSNEADYPVSIDTAETSHFGTQSKTYLVGQDDATVSIKGLVDTATSAAVEASIDAVLNGTNADMTCVFGPAGSKTGSPKYTLHALPTGYEVDAPVGGVVTFTLGLQRTGSTTRASY